MKQKIAATLTVAAFIVMCFGASLILNRNDNSRYVSVEVANHSSSNCLLRFKLKNIGNKKIQVEAVNLPWYAAGVAIIDLSGATGVVTRDTNENFTIRDFVGSIEIDPGESTEMVVSLDELHYGNAVRRNAQSDLILFWTYQLRTADGRVLPRVDGSVHLPKTTAPR